MSATSETASAGGGRLESAVFIVVTLAAAMAFWLAPHPPMADLPEHAAQIAFLHDALSGKPDRITPIEISILTPYFLSYLITLPLTFVVSIVTAMKLVLTASFFCFVFAFKSLRRELSDDLRFDWLFLIGYFGVSFQYGFYTFLVPAPLVPIFLNYAWRHARAPSGGSAAGLVLVGLCLLWAHGWLFVVAMLSGAAVVWSEVGFDVRGGLRRSGPYWGLVLAMILLMTFGPPMFNGASSRIRQLDRCAGFRPLHVHERRHAFRSVESRNGERGRHRRRRDFGHRHAVPAFGGTGAHGLDHRALSVHSRSARKRCLVHGLSSRAVRGALSRARFRNPAIGSHGRAAGRRSTATDRDRIAHDHGRGGAVQSHDHADADERFCGGKQRFRTCCWRLQRRENARSP